MALYKGMMRASSPLGIFSLGVALVAACVLPTQAQEQTSGNATSIGAVEDMRYATLRASVDVIMNQYKAQIDAILACQKNNQFWNGTTCTNPPRNMSGLVVDPNPYKVNARQFEYQELKLKAWGGLYEDPVSIRQLCLIKGFSTSFGYIAAPPNDCGSAINRVIRYNTTTQNWDLTKCNSKARPVHAVNCLKIYDSSDPAKKAIVLGP